MSEDTKQTISKNIEPIVFLLFGGIIFFTLLLVAISKWSPNDGQTFQVVSGLLTGFAGAFMMRVKPPSNPDNSINNSRINKGSDNDSSSSDNGIIGKV